MTAALAPVRIADRYTLFEQLGAGGTATVHRARDELSGRTVALKQLGAALAGKRRAMLEALFEREYQTLVRLKHPRIIEVYDYGLTGAGPYYRTCSGSITASAQRSPMRCTTRSAMGLGLPESRGTVGAKPLTVCCGH